MNADERSEPDKQTTLTPIGNDVDTAVRIAREAIFGRPWIAQRAAEIAERFEKGLRAGAVRGTLLRVNDVACGIAVWTVQGPVGLGVDLWHIVPPYASVDRYRRFLEEIRHQHGTVAFLSGDIPGLRPEEEERLLTGLGYARYGRSEMERTAESPLPPAELPAGCALRPVSRADGPELVELHARAYRHRFDRYLFLQDADEAADTRKLFDDLFGGRWGELSVAGCRGIERGGRLLGATLSVRRGPGALIIDLMVDPTVQGQGLGRTLLVETLRSLIAQREVPVKLTVTEGNTRAIGLYERLGFVRTLGPSHDWYDRSAIPVSPTD